jgi:hypothetical protein
MNKNSQFFGFCNFGKMLNSFYPTLVVLFVFSVSSSLRADMGQTPDHFVSQYGESLQTRPTPTGRIMAFKDGDMVIMGEFGGDGRARNIAYRVNSGLNEGVISQVLSKSSGVTGSFYRVDKPRLASTLDRLVALRSQPSEDTPPELLQLSQQLNPEALRQLKSTINSVSDLRATHDGKYIAMIDPRGSVLVMEINGPMLPLAE